MRSMTVEQARKYVICGYYPKENEIEAICDLQDVFGHLPYRFVTQELLMDEETKENGERLLRLIYAKDTVDSYIERRDRHCAELIEAENTRKQIAELEKRLRHLEGNINNFGYNWREEDAE